MMVLYLGILRGVRLEIREFVEVLFAAPSGGRFGDRWFDEKGRLCSHK